MVTDLVLDVRDLPRDREILDLLLNRRLGNVVLLVKSRGA